MAIAPITSVSFRNNYNQINFEGKKGEHGNNSGMTPMKKLAVPLAATVLAMTPSNVSAKYNMDAEPVTTEVMANDTVAYKYMDYVGYDPDDSDKSIRIFFLDTDGNLNNDAEALMVQTVKEVPTRKLVRDAQGRPIETPDGYKRIPIIYLAQNTMRIDTLKHEIRTIEDAKGNKSVSNIYYIVGPNTHIAQEIDKVTSEVISNKKTESIDKIEISKKFYDDLVDTLKDKVEYKTVRTTRTFKKSDEFDFLDILMPGL